MSEERFKVEVDGLTFEININEELVMVDGRPVDISVVHVSGSTYSILLDGRSHEFTASSSGSGHRLSGISGTQDVSVFDKISLLLRESALDSGSQQATAVHAPMPGLVLKIEVVEGQTVQAGDGLLVLQAMKMENEIFSSGEAGVKTIHVREGEAVTKGQLIITLD